MSNEAISRTVKLGCTGFLGTFVPHVPDALDALLDAMPGFTRCLARSMGHVLTHIRSLSRRFLRGMARLRGCNFCVMPNLGSLGESQRSDRKSVV